MALLVAGLMVVGQIVVDNDPVYIAAEAGVETQALLGAMASTGLGAREYLWMSGELERPVRAEVVARAPAASPPTTTIWDRLAQCESGGNWHVNAYHDGGLQFLPATWNAYKPAGYPAFAYQATREQQIAVAQKLQAAAGWGQWPACARRLGLR